MVRICESSLRFRLAELLDFGLAESRSGLPQKSIKHRELRRFPKTVSVRAFFAFFRGTKTVAKTLTVLAFCCYFCASAAHSFQGGAVGAVPGSFFVVSLGTMFLSRGMLCSILSRVGLPGHVCFHREADDTVPPNVVGSHFLLPPQGEYDDGAGLSADLVVAL